MEIVLTTSIHHPHEDLTALNLILSHPPHNPTPKDGPLIRTQDKSIEFTMANLTSNRDKILMVKIFITLTRIMSVGPSLH